MAQPPPIGLAELVQRAQQGDEAAQHSLIVTYQTRIARFIYAMTGRSDSVDDVAQLVFIKMIRSLDHLRETAQFEPWLFRLARNTCIDHLRKEKLLRIFTPFLASHEDLAHEPRGEDAEEIEALQYALQQLPMKDRALIILAQEGRSHAEMAAATGASLLAVKARLHRAREKLREHYRPSHDT